MTPVIPDYGPEEIVRVRKRLRVSQRMLGLALGVSTRTVEAWEAERSRPTEPARRLLYLLDGEPSLLGRLVYGPPDLIL